MLSRTRLWPAVRQGLIRVMAVLAAALASPGALTAENLLGNAGFEEGRAPWHMDTSGKTAAQFTIDDKDAGEGQRSALVSIATVDGWGIQFGQTVDAPTVGKTYTFAVLAKSTKGPVSVRLEIERRGKPWDRAAASRPYTLTKDRWTELHVTFTVEKPFPQGWFAYASCRQPDAEFRLDMFRLYEGQYVSHEQAAKEEAAVAAVSLFDTSTPAPAALASKAIAGRSGWTQVPEDKTDYRFRGEAVVINDRLALVLRRGAAGAELYSAGPAGFALCAILAPAGAERGGALSAVAITENSPGEVVVDASFRSPGGSTPGLRYALAMGQLFVRTEPRGGVSGLSVEAPCRFMVLPDFFADDMVIDAAEIPVGTAELPSENFLLHLLPSREAIVMTVASNRGQDARIDLDGQAEQRLVRRSETFYGDKGKIWVAVLQAPGVWHQHEVGRDDAGKVIALPWKAPFPAQWRIDWRLAGSLTGSWEMIAEMKGGGFVKHGWFGRAENLPADRTRWTTVLGRFKYPCWIDAGGCGHLQPLSKPDRFQGPAVIYPVNRVPGTPLREFTVVDVVRATLGVGPCEYILDVEGQGATRKGRATCATRDALKAIYAARQQKQKRAEIEKILDEVVVFVKHIRSRIDQYVDFGHEILAYLEQQKKAHPELAGFLAEMESATRAIDVVLERRKASIQTPQYVVDLTEDFRKNLLDNESDDALKKCTAITHAIVVVGGNQDELVGECRNAVKVLRQRAGLALATNPRAAEIAREIRSRTHKVLRGAASYEAPRH